MANLLNMTNDECAELIDILEREHGQLQLGIDRLTTWKEHPTTRDRQAIVRSLLWKAKTSFSTPSILDSSVFVEYRLEGYC